MELEKPKHKKKVKNKRTADAHTDGIADAPSITLAALDVDFEFPSTSIRDDLPTQECLIASQLEDFAIEQDDDDNATEGVVEVEVTASNNTDEMYEPSPHAAELLEQITQSLNEEVNQALEFETIEPVQPSAPLITHNQPLKAQISTRVCYPNLTEVQDQLLISDVNKLSNITISATASAEKVTIKPFTEAQLKELYDNPEVERADHFETEFINTELRANYKNHILYELLTKYSKCRHYLKMNEMDLSNYQKAYGEVVGKLWQSYVKSVTYSGVCSDGARLSKDEKFEVMSVNEPIFDKVSSTLNDMLNLVFFNYTHNLYSTEVHKLQIEQKIRELILNVPQSSQLPPQSPITLNTEIQPALIQPIQDIRIAISILFYFSRRPIPDKIFCNNLKDWLRKLVAILLRTATWQDHLFLIYHVLRCPAGVSSWAISFIQIPRPHQNINLSPFASNEIHHCIAFLRTLLLPINQRQEFLASQYREIGSSNGGAAIDPVQEDLWILVDSDGEEDHSPNGDSAALKEKDLIAVLNQIPFEGLFCAITFAQQKNEEYFLYEDCITGHHLLKCIALATNVVQLLGEGLKTYDSERYKQFAKMLSRLIRHTVIYVSDMHDIFKNNSTVKDAHLCARIQVEFDSFVVRASSYIYKSRFLGTWQYLAILPFSDLCIETIWKLYYSLTAGVIGDVLDSTDDDFKEKIMSMDYLNHFNDTIIDVPAEDMYYLLQTFSSMAMAREATKDYDFITRITLDLFKIGFVNEPTKETCYKISRDLLVNITSKYPRLISSLLVSLKTNFKMVDSSGAYLFKALPLEIWQPEPNDFEICAAWLLNFGFETAESSLARTMFSCLNWNFNASQTDLYLSHDLHIRMACLINEVAAKHVPEIIGVSSISESVRQVSNLVKGQSTRQQFATWCWNMVTVLRLHCLDQHREFRMQTLRNPSNALRIMPELRHLESIYQGVTDSRPLSLYLSILCSQWGHSVPQICQTGFQQLLMLLNDYRHSTVIRCLQLIAPLFLECPESMSQCDKFQLILSNLLTSDRTYIKMAKDLITTDYPGLVVELLGNMIQAQIIDHFNYGLPTPTLMINLWLQCFTANSNWMKDTNSIYIVDLILRVAFQFPESWMHAKEFFRFLYMKSEDNKQSKSSFLPFLGGSSQPLLPLPAPSINALYLALITLELEHDIFELQTKLWTELLRQLQVTPGKCSLDNILKKTITTLGCPTISSNSLVLYKWINLIIQCPHNHQLLPILCQRFFQLYLERVPLTNDEDRFSDIYGVSDKFYEHNITVMKKLKKYLNATDSHYHDESLKSNDESLEQFYMRCCQLFRSYGFWLEETRLNKLNNMQHSDFPPQYDCNRLAIIFSGDETYWTEFIYLAGIRKIQKEAANNWHKTCFRHASGIDRSLRTSSSRDEIRPNPRENLLRHLQSYDAPVLPPAVVCEPLLVSNYTTTDINHILPALKTHLKQLYDTSKQFNNTLQEFKFTDCNYKDLVRLLYSNRKTTCNRQLHCAPMLTGKACAGSVTVQFAISEPVLDERIKNKIDRNREKHQLILEQQTSIPTNKNVMDIVKIHHYVRGILEKYQIAKANPSETQLKQMSTGGINFFYEVIESMNGNECLSTFPPSRELLSEVLSQLCMLMRENQNTEGIRLLQTALRWPISAQLISDILTPSTTTTACFLEMYKYVVESHMKKCDSKILFVLLSKFDVCKWLLTLNPKLADISQLLKIIVQGLESWNQADAALIQGVLRRHLIHIFEYDFPEHYGEVLQTVLSGCSEQKLPPSVLHELLNSIFKLAQCTELNVLIPSQTNEDIIIFATSQRIFPFKVVQDTMAILSRHYQNERLQHGLHGLYPKHKDYCDTIAVLLKSFGYSMVVAAVHAYPGMLADKMVEWLWPSLCDMFSPWLVPYYPQNMQQAPANWIKQVIINNDVLLPWSELYADQAQKLIHAFLDCIRYLLDTLPTSDSILGNIFYWYEVHFGKIGVPRHILKPLHAALTQLPWNRFHPQPIHIDCIYRNLQQFLPDCHTFIGHLFLRITWEPWIHYNLQRWDFTLRHKMMSSLLLIFVKLSFEPHVRENLQFTTLLREASTYPWYLLDYNGIDGVFDWFILTAEPSIILHLSSEHETVDTGILSILQMASSMNINSPSNLTQSQIQAKRMLYVKSVVRLLRLCGSKYHQLLSHKDGLKSFHAAVIHLLGMIENITSAENEGRNNEPEAINLMIEVVGSLQSQGEFTSRIFSEAIIIWQSNSKIGSIVLCSTLNAIGMCKAHSNNMQMLLEATIFNYFRSLETTKQYHDPSWKQIFARLGPSLPAIEGNELVQRNNLLTLHLYTIYKLTSLKNVGEKITLLQNLHRILEAYKTNESTEAKLVALWGLMIVSGVQYLHLSDSSRNLLLTLGRFLQMVANQADGWSDGVLGAFGLKKDTISKKRKLLTRCMSCIVFSMFPDTSDTKMPCKEYTVAIDDLANIINGKKYAELRNEGKMAIEIIQNQRSDSSRTKYNICALIRLFYAESFLNTLEDVWIF